MLAVERRFHPRAQGCGGRAGPREVLAATVIDAARQAGAGCSQSCTAGVSTTGTGEQLRQALWSSRESSEPGACSFKAFLSQQQRAPCLALARSSQCSLGLGGRRGCTPAMGVSGASFPALTLQLSPGVPPQVGSQGARCACLPPSSSGAHCSVPGGSVPGGVAFLSQPALLGTRPTGSGSPVCVHWQPLPGHLWVGVGQVVSLQSEHLPLSSLVPGTVSLILR